MTTIKNIFAVVAFLLVASCSSNDDTTPEDPEVFPQEITPVLIAHRNMSSNFPEIAPNRVNLIIDNSSDWIDFLETMGTITGQFSETVIDFEEYEIIASFNYYNGHPFDDVKIISVIENLDNMVIDIEYTETPEDSCFGFTGDTFRQFYIIKIPKSPKPIQFENSIIIPECPEE